MAIFVGEDPAVLQVIEACDMVAADSVTVLLRGETGVGKEILARKIHQSSKRRNAPFVVVNCPAITETIAESELFGHEKGAFTGAGTGRDGLLAAAAGGSLFLDEVGDMDMAVQLKLLRFLTGDPELREIRRVGSAGMKTVDVRIIAATNQALMSLVKSGKFRSDLFYRLNPVTIVIPPLRKRMNDLPRLVSHFLRADSITVSDGAMEKLRGHDWPGNVRELEGALRLAKMFASHRKHKQIEAEDIKLSTETEEEVLIVDAG